MEGSCGDGACEKTHKLMVACVVALPLTPLLLAPASASALPMLLLQNPTEPEFLFGNTARHDKKESSRSRGCREESCSRSRSRDRSGSLRR